MFDFDHLFLWGPVGGLEADRLATLGLAEGEPNTHPGQGTACRRFFFRNAYLELLWVADPAEAQCELVRPTGLWDRWCGRPASTSPFGVCLRPSHAGTAGLPFPAWEYRPPYLPSPLAIHVGEGVPLAEPMWFYLAFARRPDDPASPRRQPLDHPAGCREVTAVRLTGPGLATPSEVARAVVSASVVTLANRPEPLAEVTFDGGTQGRSADLRPALPLTLCW